MDASNGELSIMDWDEGHVHNLLCSLGFPQYQAQIREHNISGDVLCLLSPEELKDVGVATIGQRLSILKAVYQIKLAHNVPIDADHYIPPSEAQEHGEDVTLRKLYGIVKDQHQRLRHLEDENIRLNESLHIFLDDQRNSGTERPEDGSLRRAPSFKWGPYVKPAKSPTKQDHLPSSDSPQASPQAPEYPVPPHPPAATAGRSIPPPQFHSSSHSNPNSNPGSNSSSNVNTPTPRVHVTESPKPSRNDRDKERDPGSGSDNLKSFKVSLDDPTWKVLPAALKKYRINNDSWQNYAMFICYGSTGNRIERCLSYDEKPLLLFQKLKDAKKNPVFMLKHIKDIRSPIAVAQQKHAARKASSTIDGLGGGSAVMQPSTSSSSAGNGSGNAGGNGKPGGSAGHARAASRPPRLEVSDMGHSQPIMSGVAPQTGWPEILSPTIEKQEHELPPSATSTMGGEKSQDGQNGHASGSGGPVVREIPVPIAGVSYAVAIYPYMAEQDDEFDVVVGDTFVILSRARGWWVVQRDPTGSGVLETDTSKQGWVPAGCLLETSVPVASAIADAKAAASSRYASAPPAGTPPLSPFMARTPILPLSIISTSFPGIALMDYKKKGEEELDLVKDDALRVFKRYNHWSYAVKEDGGDRGWVPSWFIGKVSNATAGVPPTPSAMLGPNSMSESDATGSSNGQPQVSPMSSAFPAQGRSTAVIGS